MTPMRRFELERYSASNQLDPFSLSDTKVAFKTLK